VVKDSIGRFYLIVLKPLEPVRQREEDVYQNVIALDPGFRTFLTGFDPRAMDSSLGSMVLILLKENYSGLIA